MKKIIGFSALILIFGAILLTAFSPPADEYRFGYRTTLSPTFAAAVSVELNHTLTVIDLTTTGTVTFSLASVSKSVLGDRAVFIIKATGAAKDTVKWGTNFTALTSTVDTAKTKVFEFIYDGTDFKGVSTPLQLSLIQENSYWYRYSYKCNDTHYKNSCTKNNIYQMNVGYRQMPV